MRGFDEDDIATASFIEHFILTSANQSGALDDASRKVCVSFGMSETHVAPFVQVRLLTLLYCLLVFPSELWRRKGPIHSIVEAALQDPDLMPSVRDLMEEKSLKHMRNAVAHARVKFVDDRVTLTDVDRSGKLRFERTIANGELINLLLVIGRAFHECRTSPVRLH